MKRFSFPNDQGSGILTTIFPIGITMLGIALLALLACSCSPTRRLEAKAYDSTLTIDYVPYRLVRGRSGNDFIRESDKPAYLSGKRVMHYRLEEGEERVAGK